MKKLLLSLGALSAVVAPVAAVVACSSDKDPVTPAATKDPVTPAATKDPVTPTTTEVTNPILTAQIDADTASIAKTDKEEAKKEIKATALAALAKIDATSTDKLELVNAVVEEFIEAEGSGVAFGQKNQGKQFTFKADGSFNWTQVDTGHNGHGIDYADVATFEGRTPRDKDSYEGMQNEVLRAAEAKLKATA